MTFLRVEPRRRRNGRGTPADRMLRLIRTLLPTVAIALFVAAPAQAQSEVDTEQFAEELGA